jgi:hypothetical protein
MKVSNLAECLGEFADIMAASEVPREKAARIVAIDNCGTPRRAPRRLSLDSRRIQIRDTGLRHFRVF